MQWITGYHVALPNSEPATFHHSDLSALKFGKEVEGGWENCSIRRCSTAHVLPSSTVCHISSKQSASPVTGSLSNHIWCEKEPKNPQRNWNCQLICLLQITLWCTQRFLAKTMAGEWRQSDCKYFTLSKKWRRGFSAFHNARLIDRPRAPGGSAKQGRNGRNFCTISASAAVRRRKGPTSCRGKQDVGIVLLLGVSSRFLVDKLNVSHGEPIPDTVNNVHAYPRGNVWMVQKG